MTTRASSRAVLAALALACATGSARGGAIQLTTPGEYILFNGKGISQGPMMSCGLDGFEVKAAIDRQYAQANGLACGSDAECSLAARRHQFLSIAQKEVVLDALDLYMLEISLVSGGPGLVMDVLSLAAYQEMEGVRESLRQQHGALVDYYAAGSYPSSMLDTPTMKHYMSKFQRVLDRDTSMLLSGKDSRKAQASLKLVADAATNLTKRVKKTEENMKRWTAATGASDITPYELTGGVRHSLVFTQLGTQPLGRPLCLQNDGRLYEGRTLVGGPADLWARISQTCGCARPGGRCLLGPSGKPACLPKIAVYDSHVCEEGPDGLSQVKFSGFQQTINHLATVYAAARGSSKYNALDRYHPCVLYAPYFDEL
ncbi:MAG: hypothetical protein HY927_06805 [Elusimicrobia bacterium]|nr:hypothetical protein [Elusimicrobiota bacterium]